MGGPSHKEMLASSAATICFQKIKGIQMHVHDHVRGTEPYLCVSAGRDTNAMGVRLLRRVVHNNTGASNHLIFWNALNFCTLLTRFQVALGHPAKVFAKGGLPDLGSSQIFAINAYSC